MPVTWQIVVVALWAVVLVQIGMVLVLFRQVGLVYLEQNSARSRDGLTLNSTRPRWRGIDHKGELVDATFFDGSAMLLVFADPNCGPCQRLMPELQSFVETNRDVPVVVVGGDDKAANAQMADRYLLEAPVVADELRALSDAFRVTVTPFLYVIDADGQIRDKGIANSREQIERKLEAAKEVFV